MECTIYSSLYIARLYGAEARHTGSDGGGGAGVAHSRRVWTCTVCSGALELSQDHPYRAPQTTVIEYSESRVEDGG